MKDKGGLFLKKQQMLASWFTTKKLDWGVVLVFFDVHLGSFSSEMQFLNDDEHELPSLQAAVGKKVTKPIWLCGFQFEGGSKR